MDLNIAQYDFLPRFYQLAIANVLSNLMVPIAGLVSVAFLGHLENIQYLAGVAATAVLFTYVYRLLNFLRMSTTGVTARAFGEGDQDAMILVGLRNGFIALVLGLALVALQSPLQALWFYLLDTDPAIQAAGTAYFNARIWGAPAVAINLVLIGWLVGREMSGKVLFMAVIGNVANIIFDYFSIVRWGWGSLGAGLSACCSQYLILLIGLFFLVQEFQIKDIQKVIKKFWDATAFKSTFTFNRDIFIRILANRVTLIVFTIISSALGGDFLVENSLILEVILITISCIEGVGFTLETLTGNFEGSQEQEKVVPLIITSLINSICIGLAFATITFIFPQSIFSLLTNHSDINGELVVYLPWLFCILGFISVAFMLDGYFLGLADGRPPRNSAITGLIIGFIPMSIVALQNSSNHLLWLAFSLFAIVRAGTITVQVLRVVGNPLNPEQLYS